jgi:hypothetical protein
MPRRCGWLLVMAVMTPGLWARGQLLDLGGPPVPGAGQGLAALELAARLDGEADRLEAEQPGEALAVLRRDGRVALRRAASTLAELGEAHAAAGSPAVLWAMTIETRLAELDRLIAESRDGPLLAALAADWQQLELDWSRGRLPEPEALDESIGSALAQLALDRSALGLGAVRVGAGWLPSGEAISADDLRARAGSLSAAGVEAEIVRSMEWHADRLERTWAWPTYARRASAEAGLMVDAADGLLSLPGWTTPACRARLTSDLAEGLGRETALDAVVDSVVDPVVDPVVDWGTPGRRGALLGLVIEHARLLNGLDRLDPGREADRLRVRACEAIAGRQHDDLTAVRIAAEGVVLSVSRPDTGADERIVRVVRPAWRGLVPLVRQTTVTARDAAVNLLLDPAQATDPGTLAALAAQRRLFEDFAVLERLSVELESGLEMGSERGAGAGEGSGVAPSLLGPFEDRVLALGQDVGQEPTRAQALTMLRSMDAQLAHWRSIAADRATAVRVMGERGRELPERIGSLEEAWLRGWGVPGGNGPESPTLTELSSQAQVMALLSDAEALTRQDTINAWPGLELSPRARRSLAQGLTEAIDELLPDAMRAGNAVSVARTADRLVALRGAYAPALLVGRLSRLAQARGIELSSALEELALGPPTPGAWMVRHRAAIAEVCRYAEELGRVQVQSRGDDESLARLGNVTRWRALRTLEAIEADARSAAPGTP